MADNQAAAFCILDRPFVVWSDDQGSDNRAFLDSIDHNFYYRTVHRVFFPSDDTSSLDFDDEQQRKDQSAFARLLWHHGAESLLMLIGALIQAPHAVEGFFLRCRNEDCRAIAQYLISSNLPANHCLARSDFSLDKLVESIHNCAGWNDNGVTISYFTRSLTNIFREFDRDDHRAEYNSIKHGLRATHGQFGLAMGLQDAPGIPAPAERMQNIVSSKDGSHFPSVSPISGIVKAEQKRQFTIRHHSLGWSLEKTLCEIQLFSTFIGNVVSALKISEGAGAENVKFERPEDADCWWTTYFAMSATGVRNFSFGPSVGVLRSPTSADKKASEFYKKHAELRKQNDALHQQHVKDERR